MTTDSEINDAIAAIHAGDLSALQRLLAHNPGLAASRLGALPKVAHPCTWLPTGRLLSERSPNCADAHRSRGGPELLAQQPKLNLPAQGFYILNSASS